MLPNFLIVGAAKSGTTSLYHYLNQHPQVYMSPIKEPFFFTFINKKSDFQGPFDQKTNESIIKSFDEYKKLFRGVTDEKAIGECSNSYLYFQDTAANIKRFIPECKIIIMLRNPIERAYSHHLQFVMLGQEDLTFENALKKEEERKKLNWRWHYQLMGQGLYYSQVKRYIDEFEAKNVSIHLFEELKETPNELMKNIYDFLCVDSEFKPQADKIYNKGGLPKNMFVHKLLRGSNLIKDVTRAFTSKKIRGKLYSVLSEINYEYKNRPVINERTKKHMVDVFKDDALKLQNLINRDLSAWFN